MEKEMTSFEKIAAEIASKVNEEAINKFATEALESAVQNYNVKRMIENLVTPKIKEAAQKILPTDKFQKQLESKVEEELVGILDCAVKQVCKNLVQVLQKGG